MGKKTRNSTLGSPSLQILGCSQEKKSPWAVYRVDSFSVLALQPTMILALAPHPSSLAVLLHLLLRCGSYSFFPPRISTDCQVEFRGAVKTQSIWTSQQCGVLVFDLHADIFQTQIMFYSGLSFFGGVGGCSEGTEEARLGRAGSSLKSLSVFISLLHAASAALTSGPRSWELSLHLQRTRSALKNLLPRPLAANWLFRD